MQIVALHLYYILLSEFVDVAALQVAAAKCQPIAVTPFTLTYLHTGASVYNSSDCILIANLVADALHYCCSCCWFFCCFGWRAITR